MSQPARAEALNAVYEAAKQAIAAGLPEEYALQAVRDAYAEWAKAGEPTHHD